MPTNDLDITKTWLRLEVPQTLGLISLLGLLSFFVIRRIRRHN